MSDSPIDNVPDGVPVETKLSRAKALDTIVEQAAEGHNWQTCCAQLMSAYGISTEDVSEGLKQRPKLLINEPVRRPALIVFVLGLGADTLSLVWHPFLYPRDLSLFSALIICFFGYQCLYCLGLLWAHSKGIYVSKRAAHAWGGMASLVPTAAGVVVLMHLPHVKELLDAWLVVMIGWVLFSMYCEKQLQFPPIPTAIDRDK